jgi:hypothetical protein
MSKCHVCGAEATAGAAFCASCGAKLDAEKPKGWSSGIFDYRPHPHIENRKKKVPKVAHALAPDAGAVSRFNRWLGVRITDGVGTMWCAYGFAVIALISLPQAIQGGVATLIAWIAQTFLQLVLLSIIMVGQKVQGVASDNRAIDTYKDAEALLAEVVEIQKHLLAQDAWLQQLITAYRSEVHPPPETPGK